MKIIAPLVSQKHVASFSYLSELVMIKYLSPALLNENELISVIECCGGPYSEWIIHEAGGFLMTPGLCQLVTKVVNVLYTHFLTKMKFRIRKEVTSQVSSLSIWLNFTWRLYVAARKRVILK
jgi:hypothetical protein